MVLGSSAVRKPYRTGGVGGVRGGFGSEGGATIPQADGLTDSE